MFKSKQKGDFRQPPSIPPAAPKIEPEGSEIAPDLIMASPWDIIRLPGKQTINEDGIAFIKEFEGCFLLSYPDPASELARACRKAGISAYTRYTEIPDWQNLKGAPWTIGWGATGPDIGPQMQWTQEQADARLLIELEEHMEYVRKQLAFQDLTATPNQFAALTSFTYNCGPSNLRRVLSNGLEGFPDKVLLFNKAQGQVLPGLTRRREAERKLFLEG